MAAEEQAWNHRQLAGVVAAPSFRVWLHASPAIILGCSQSALMDTVRQRLRGRATLLVRESGGGAVLAGPWLVSASVVLPPTHSWLTGGLVQSYRQWGQLHAVALATLGVPAHVLSPEELSLARRTQGARRIDWACFGTLSPWEVVSADGRKLVGLAQRRRQGGVLLVAGTLITEPDWKMLCDAMGRPRDMSIFRQRTVACAELTRQPLSPRKFAEVLAQELGHALVGAQALDVDSQS